MSVQYYPAIIEGAAGEGYSVFFPDLSGCASAGDTLQEAASNAEEALNFHLAGMAEDNEQIPIPSALDTLEVDSDIQVAARVLVRAEMPGNKVRINLTMDEWLVSAIDTRTSNRSAWLADLARAELSRHP